MIVLRDKDYGALSYRSVEPRNQHNTTPTRVINHAFSTYRFHFCLSKKSWYDAGIIALALHNFATTLHDLGNQGCVT